ncbi:MAG TPA: VOC family protein [Candidatus Cybelea sp.]|nr:VOC family protein [Candidatus Cybelea sp.]
MVRILGIDHISVKVADFERSKRFYAQVLGFLGFKLKYEFSDTAGWSNGKTLYWIGEADEEGKKHPHRIGNIGLHHYAFELAARKDVDALYELLKKIGATIVDPAGEYYDGGYYAVYFLDPDGMKLEGMFYPKPKRKPAKKKSVKRRRR